MINEVVLKDFNADLKACGHSLAPGFIDDSKSWWKLFKKDGYTHFSQVQVIRRYWWFE